MKKDYLLLFIFIFIFGCSVKTPKQELFKFPDQITQCKYIFFKELYKNKQLKIDTSDFSVFLSKSNIFDLDTTRFSSSLSAISSVYKIFTISNKKIYIIKIYIPEINCLFKHITKQLNKYIIDIVYNNKNKIIYNIEFEKKKLYLEIDININEFKSIENKDNNINNIVKDAKYTNKYNSTFNIYVGENYNNNEIENYYYIYNPIKIKLLKILSENGYISILNYGKANLAIFKGKVYTFKNIEKLDLKLIDI